MSDFDPPPILDDDTDPASPDAATAAEEAVPPAPEGTKARETQWDIVKRQFGKHRAAVWGLRVTAMLALLAIYAPLIASAQPFVFSAGEDSPTTYPWFTTLLDANVWEHTLDRLFNIAMILVTVFFLGRLVMRFKTNSSAKVKRGWRKVMIAATIGLCIAHGVFDLGMTQSTAVEYRATQDAVKDAEDAVAAVPIGIRFQEALAASRTDFAAIREASASAERDLQALKSRAASRVLRPLADLRQALSASEGDVELALRRYARASGLLMSEEDRLELGSDALVGEDLLAAWKQQEGDAELDPRTLLKKKAERLAFVPGPVADGLRGQLQQLSDKVRDDLATAVRLYEGALRRAELPTLDEAKAQLAKAQAARDEQTILYPPVPYGYREQLPQGYDSLRGSFDTARGELHVFGTDQTGRDVFARILYGTRIALTIGIFAVSIYVTIGVILGALAGYFRGWVDMVIMRSVEILICIPGLFLILTIVALFDQKSIWLIMFAIAIVSWTGITRLVRGEFLRERNSEYVLAAQAMGYSTPRIIFRHVLPNSVGPVLVSATFGIAAAILTESGLSFLGLGDVSVPSWGGVLNEGRTEEQWHMIVPPSVAIFITVTALNLVGDGVRDALDPKLRN